MGYYKGAKKLLKIKTPEGQKEVPKENSLGKIGQK